MDALNPLIHARTKELLTRLAGSFRFAGPKEPATRLREADEAIRAAEEFVELLRSVAASLELAIEEATHRRNHFTRVQFAER